MLLLKRKVENSCSRLILTNKTMGFPSISHSLSIDLLFILVVLCSINEYDAQGNDKMPSIWDTGEDGHGQMEQSYRFVAEVRVVDTEKVS